MDLVPMSVFERTGALWLPPLAEVRPEPELPATIRIVGDRRMQCKDIPDEAFLGAVRRTLGWASGKRSTAGEAWRMRWDVQAELEKETGPLPLNLFLAKARRLGRRRLLGGCTDCLCRGDYHIAVDCPWPTCCPPRNPSGA
ncbi:hypothetical protein [Streptomyces turgidiscabies]|nr:hypothetical protein [Streptomyces turgidiscabies]